MLMIGVGIGDYPTKSSEGQTEGKGGDKDSLPFYYRSPSCVVSSEFDKKFLKRDGRCSNEGKFNGPFTPDIKELPAPRRRRERERS